MITHKKNKTKLSLKNLVAKGNISDAISILKKLLSAHKNAVEKLNELLIIEYQFNSIAAKDRINLLEASSELLLSNRVIKSLLIFIDTLEGDFFLNKIPSNNHSSNSDAIFVKLKFKANLEDKEEIELLLAELSKYCNDYTMALKTIEKGSTILTLAVSPETFEKMRNGIKSGELQNLFNYDLVDLSVIHEDSIDKSFQRVSEKLGLSMDILEGLKAMEIRIKKIEKKLDKSAKSEVKNKKKFKKLNKKLNSQYQTVLKAIRSNVVISTSGSAIKLTSPDIKDIKTHQPKWASPIIVGDHAKAIYPIDFGTSYSVLGTNIASIKGNFIGLNARQGSYLVLTEFQEKGKDEEE